MAKAFRIRKVSANDDSAEAAVQIMQTRLREFYSRWPDADVTPNAEQLHALRISGKRLRYSAESLREFYPDRLALLLNLLRQLQDVLGEMQDYETQRAIIEADLARLKARRARQQNSAESNDGRDEMEAAIADLLNDYRRKQEKLLAEFTLLWRGLSSRKFRRALKSLVTHPIRPRQKETTHD
jgi:CHAD domain-containing protein